MSETDVGSFKLRQPGVSLSLQLAAWAIGLAACIAGTLDWVGEWHPALATVQLVALAMAPVVYMLPNRRRGKKITATVGQTGQLGDFWICLILGGISFVVSSRIGTQIGDLPPAYHDEFSYLFQARTLLSGRFTFPSHPLHAELFDQMHVLNEGRMASRYYPGTGLWLAPFVAFGHPFPGQWIAGAVATMMTFLIGREVCDRVTGIYAGLIMGLSPGIGLFGNTLLAHQPTLLALSFFMFGAMRWLRTRSATDAGIAGSGLSAAMLCRPMTAAAVGLPVGIAVAGWLILNRTSRANRSLPVSPIVAPQSGQIPLPGDASPRLTPSRAGQWWGTLLGFGLPLMFGWGIMLSYNHAVTGHLLKSPYQLYTEVYTPRHVYGFNNRVRGERHLGSKVIDAYDRWALNLTPELAVSNSLTRWIASWQWTFDILPLVLCTVIISAKLPQLDRRWGLILASIISLHLMHVPYWYVGIMGWHYVYESAPLWCLIAGGATSLLFAEWRRREQTWLPYWWRALLAISLAGIYLAPTGLWPSRLQRALSILKHPRSEHAILRRWVEQNVDHRPALVLLDQHQTVDSHLDLMVNEPGLHAGLLLGRYRPGQTDVQQIRRDFPDRQVYVACPERKTIQRID